LNLLLSPGAYDSVRRFNSATQTSGASSSTRRIFLSLAKQLHLSLVLLIGISRYACMAIWLIWCFAFAIVRVCSSSFLTSTKQTVSSENGIFETVRIICRRPPPDAPGCPPHRDAPAGCLPPGPLPDALGRTPGTPPRDVLERPPTQTPLDAPPRTPPVKLTRAAQGGRSETGASKSLNQLFLTLILVNYMCCLVFFDNKRSLGGLFSAPFLVFRQAGNESAEPFGQNPRRGTTETEAWPFEGYLAAVWVESNSSTAVALTSQPAQNGRRQSPKWTSAEPKMDLGGVQNGCLRSSKSTTSAELKMDVDGSKTKELV